MTMGGSTAEATPAPPTKIGNTLLVGTLIASILALVPLFRGDAAPSLILWFACAGSGALVLGPLLLGARALEGSKGALMPAACALAVAAGPLMLLGRLIKTATHHRPLGAMTYAAVACALVLCAWALTWRLYTFSREGSNARLRRVSQVGLGVLLLPSAALVLMSLADVGHLAGAVLLDGSLMLVLAALALYTNLSARLSPVVGLVGGLLWVGVVAAGLVAALQLGQSLVSVSLPLSVLSALVTQ